MNAKYAAVVGSILLIIATGLALDGAAYQKGNYSTLSPLIEDNFALTVFANFVMASSAAVGTLLLGIALYASIKELVQRKQGWNDE